MELITDIVLKYIRSGKRIVIPELGAFLVKPSTGEIVFSEFLKHDDGVLRGELVNQGMKSVEAAGAINRFVFEVRRVLRSGEQQRLKGIGVLTLNKLSLKIEFEPIDENNAPIIYVQPQKRVKKEESQVASPVEAEHSATEQSAEQPVAEELSEHQKAEELAKEVKEAVKEAAKEAAKEAKELVASNKKFSGKFGDEDQSVKSLIYTKDNNKSRAYRGRGQKSKRKFDFVMFLALMVLLAALGAIGYGVYISMVVGEVNPMLQVWDDVVEIYNQFIEWISYL
ncbi:MAG: hypothetical protein SNJ33_04905 [Rikenellaceae bacterium]